MSHRVITENLRYFIDNMGSDLTLPVLNVTVNGNGNITSTGTMTAGGTWNYTGTLNYKGTSVYPLVGNSKTAIVVTPGTSVAVVPYWPRLYDATTPNFAYAGGNAATDITINNMTQNVSSFGVSPSPGSLATFFVNPGATSIRLAVAGHLRGIVTLLLGTAMTNPNSYKLTVSVSTNSGGAYAELSGTKVDWVTGDPTMNTITTSFAYYIATAAISSTYFKFTMTGQQAQAACTVRITYMLDAD